MGEGARYRHWRNRTVGPSAAFITATALDFAPVFAEYRKRDTMAASIAEDCRRAKVPLFAYEVMPNHSHLLVAPQEGVSVADAMKRIKSNSARRIRPTLSEERLGQLSKQTGLNRRTFWQQSFRSVPVITDSVFQQKESYTIWNPVKAGYCDLPEDYRWSGAHARLLQLVDQDGGLDLNAIVNLYAPQGLPHF